MTFALSDLALDDDIFDKFGFYGWIQTKCVIANCTSQIIMIGEL